MTVYNPLPEVFPEDKTAVALGMFDGLHKGHMAVINALINNSEGLVPCVFTFSAARPGPKKYARLMSAPTRDCILGEMGVEYILEPDFSLFRDVPAAVFVKSFLKEYLRAGLVFCGEDFHFGKDASGSARDLSAFPDMRAVVIPNEKIAGGVISSTRIRGLVAEGEMERAAELLGRDFTIDFEVCHGRGLGRKLGIPTINQAFPDGFIVPRFGVYASEAEIAGKRLRAVTNVGVKPTVGSDRVLAETHIDGFTGDLYDQGIRVGLKRFIRPERRFESVQALREQIMRDLQESRAM